MTASRAKPMKIPFVAFAAAFGVAFFSILSPVGAQPAGPGGGPLMLAPPQRLEPQRPGDSGTAPAAPGSPAAQPDLEMPASGVLVDSLSRIDPDSVGTLSAAEGGFGQTLWQDTSRALVDDLLPQLPVKAVSATQRQLMRRLLLSAAPPPQGEGNGTPLITVRVGLLASMGALDDAEALLQAAPNRTAYADLARLETDLHFLANDNARACALTAAGIREDDAPYWQKALIFCQALAGDHDKASLGVALMRELGADDPIFFELFDALITAGGDREVESMAEAEPLHLAMARAAGVQLPADVVAGNRPAVLKVVATTPNASVDLRLDAAERAVSVGALSPETLRQIYGALSFTEEQLANPLSRAEAESGPVSRALLFRTASVQTIPTAQAEAVAKALDLGREGGRYAPTVRVFLPILQKIPPSAELVWFAPSLIRAYLIAGEYELAEPWFGILRASALFNPESETAVTLLRPILRLSGVGEAADWPEDGLTAWWTLAGGSPEGRDHAALLFSLFDAFGETVPAGLWTEMLDGPARTTAAVPQPALWFQLRNAADDRRIGETVMLSLLALGDSGAAGTDPMTLRDVAIRLRAIGLENEARALGVESAVAAGL